MTGEDDRHRLRVERIGLNEATFRQVNEQIERLAGTLRSPDRHLDLVCECGRAECAEKIRLDRSEYEAVRADPLLFAVVPGHVLPEAESVVRSEARFDVVRKDRGVPEEVARSTDPRR